MSTFSVDGKGHRVLERLADGSCDFATLAEACGVGPDRKGRRKLHRTIGAMLACEIIGGRRESFYLHPAGRDALEALRAGHPTTIEERVTSVRVFA